MAVHPELVRMLAMRASLNPRPYHTMSPNEARLAYIQGQNALPANRGAPVHEIYDRAIPVPGGDIRARIFQPGPRPSLGKILYFHGGGWVLGTVETFEPVCRELAVASGLDVVSVDYRLAPEHAFPGPVEDAYAALLWLAGNAGSAPLVVMGDSAGAHLAAACAIKARDEDGPAIALQVLIYPVTDCDFTRGSYVEFGPGHCGMSAGDMKWFWDHYAPAPEMRESPLAAPFLVRDLSGLPPAIVAVAGSDVLRDEGIAYARRLDEAGVSTVLEVFPDMIHGFFTMVDIFAPANAAIHRIGADIARRVASATDRDEHNRSKSDVI